MSAIKEGRKIERNLRTTATRTRMPLQSFGSEALARKSVVCHLNTSHGNGLSCKYSLLLRDSLKIEIVRSL
jgi:hypothetical protein